MDKRDLEKEFDAKYNDYGKMLFKIAFLYVGNSADAEDILQDVFLVEATASKTAIMKKRGSYE